MARNKANAPNIQAPTGDYPNGRIRDNDGTNNGTPVNEFIYGDIHENIAKLMRRYSISYNNLPDNETNGYQFIEALRALPSKNDRIITVSGAASNILLSIKLSRLESNEVLIGLSATSSQGKTTALGTLDNSTKPLNIIGNFVAGDYLMFVNTPSNITVFTIYRNENFLGAERSLVLNQGGFDLGDIGEQSGGHSYTTFGEIETAIKAGVFQSATDEIELTFKNEMPDTNYKVKFDIESLSGNLGERSNYRGVTFFDKSTTSCKMVIQKTNPLTASDFRVHIDVIKLKS